jgi:hypothetical protein
MKEIFMIILFIPLISLCQEQKLICESRSTGSYSEQKEKWIWAQPEKLKDYQITITPQKILVHSFVDTFSHLVNGYYFKEEIKTVRGLDNPLTQKFYAKDWDDNDLIVVIQPTLVNDKRKYYIDFVYGNRAIRYIAKE